VANDRFDGLNWDDDEGETPSPNAAVLMELAWVEAMRASIKLRMP
jgi:hypothetical protein